ncbi:hypothetical protein [Saccharibacillus qingshengii]|uniref:hypothetical protein n=1 Tax=Saccharibacillus qingshengii TaxID=1763540 RepID=UPI00155487CD|nr:hypothetical protein [Saccharibacillus qingshengii]
MKKMQVILASLLMGVTAGCGSEEKFEPNVWAEREMCVIKVEDTEADICYGMEREEAEQATGAVAEEDKPTGTMYADGLRVFYREGKVAAIDLTEPSRGVYRTARGAQVGMTRTELIDLYGDAYMKETGPGHLDYYYDIDAKRLLQDPQKDLAMGSEEDLQNTHLISIQLDGDEKAEFISVMDRRRAVRMD